jgi:hypothetical protein
MLRVFRPPLLGTLPWDLVARRPEADRLWRTAESYPKLMLAMTTDGVAPRPLTRRIQATGSKR